MNPELQAQVAEARASRIAHSVRQRLERFVRISETLDDPDRALADIGIKSLDDVIEFLDDLTNMPEFAARCDGARRAGRRAYEARREAMYPRRSV